MRQVFYAPAARADIAELTRRIVANNGPLVAEKVMGRVKQSLERLSQFPHIGRARPQLGAGIHSWPIARPFTVLFRIRTDAIEILRIVDGRRRFTRKMASGADR